MVLPEVALPKHDSRANERRSGSETNCARHVRSSTGRDGTISVHLLSSDWAPKCHYLPIIAVSGESPKHHKWPKSGEGYSLSSFLFNIHSLSNETLTPPQIMLLKQQFIFRGVF